MEFTRSNSSGSGSEDSNESCGFAGPNLQTHGDQPSAGGASHPNGCTPCAFYCFKRSGCRKGDDCMYCHMSHISKQRQRRDQWKKDQREKRCVARECARVARLTETDPSCDDACLPHGCESPSALDAETQAASLHSPARPVEHLATVAKAIVDRTLNATATAEFKHPVPHFNRAPGTEVPANFPEWHPEVAASRAAMSTQAAMLAVVQHLQKLNLSVDDMQQGAKKAVPLQPPGSRVTNISKQNLELRPDEPCWLAYNCSTLGSKTSLALCHWRL